MTAQHVKEPGDAAELHVQDLVVDYPLGRRRTRRAVDGVSLTVPAGSTLGVVGESGSGKSTIAKAVLGMAPVTSGSITYGDRGLVGLPSGRRPQEIQVVFQDPYSSLNPTKTIGYTLEEPLRAQEHRTGVALGRAGRQARVHEMLERVGLPASTAGRYPSQFSGGQRQRISIARALMLDPELVICDEAVSALDLSIQAQILNLLLELQHDLGVSLLFISHDLGVVDHIAQQVLVLYRGRVMETGDSAAIHARPAHPYTRALVMSAPVQDPGRQRERRERRRAETPVAGMRAPLGDSCPFAHRCALATELCSRERPQLRTLADGRAVACHHAELEPAETLLTKETR